VGFDYSKLRLTFIEVPALYVRRAHGFEVFIGPQYSHLITASIVDDGQSENIKGYLKKSVFDARVGVGMSPGRVGFQLSYIKGLSPVYEGYNTVWKNNTLVVSLAWRVTGVASPRYRKTDIPHRTLE
jgi:hypothetical protein